MKKLLKFLGILSLIVAAVSFVLWLFVVPKTKGNSTAANSESQTTKTYQYTSMEEGTMPSDIEQSIEVDGRTYILPDNYEEYATTVTANTNKRHTETAVVTGLTSMQAPETKDFEVEGKTVTLTLSSADYTPVERSYSAEGDIEYPELSSKSAVPENAEISYESEDGSVITVPGTLVSVSTKSDAGSSDYTTQIKATVSMPKWTNVYMVGDKAITYDPATPRWDGYEQDVAKAAGLSSGQRVTGGIWSGGTYEEDGVVKRDVIWYVQGTSSNTIYVGHYEASGTLTTYTADAVYSGSCEALGLSEESANEIAYDLETEIPYILEGTGTSIETDTLPSNAFTNTVASNKNNLPIIGLIALWLGLILLFISIAIGGDKKKAKKSEKGENDDEEDTGNNAENDSEDDDDDYNYDDFDD